MATKRRHLRLRFPRARHVGRPCAFSTSTQTFSNVRMTCREPWFGNSVHFLNLILSWANGTLSLLVVRLGLLRPKRSQKQVLAVTCGPPSFERGLRELKSTGFLLLRYFLSTHDFSALSDRSPTPTTEVFVTRSNTRNTIDTSL